jgi:hypothetical protein
MRDFSKDLRTVLPYLYVLYILDYLLHIPLATLVRYSR